jgi:hypothetical protein
MRPTSVVSNDTAPRAARLVQGVLRVGITMGFALVGMSAVIPEAGAEPTTLEPQQADASNGGIASATSGGDVDIGEIVTGENTGNSIITGDIGGPAELDGGEIAYPTEINVTQIVEPSSATADGGEQGEATITTRITPDESTTDDGDSSVENEITIINRNDNRSQAIIE